jgi:hypothetical protein
MGNNASALLCDREASLPQPATAYGAYYKDFLQLVLQFVYICVWKMELVSVCDPTNQTPIKDWLLGRYVVLAMLGVWNAPNNVNKCCQAAIKAMHDLYPNLCGLPQYKTYLPVHLYPNLCGPPQYKTYQCVKKTSTKLDAKLNMSEHSPTCRLEKTLQ